MKLTCAHPCSFLIAAGDPQQLPPHIATPSTLTATPSATQPPHRHLQGNWGGAQSTQSMQGSLIRPLFVRLCLLGYEK